MDDTIPSPPAPHAIALEVRDYECDLQGVVNNAVYQNYLEHARHEFLKSAGIDFAALAAAGINLVVVRAELEYRAPLRPGDRFRVLTRVERESRVRLAFVQAIHRDGEDKPVLTARIVGTALNERGRPHAPDFLDRLA
ncbi:MAG TPA: acyl-CoA thioesterase [Armatimonadaceae bacterium]|nr:acyl-CoA thioesterase [Armatimonadaceae bacterium]